MFLPLLDFSKYNLILMMFKKKFVFPFLSVFLVFILLLFNFSSGTFLIGWDNLQTDLNPVLNFKRALNVSWQEYQGLGLLGGMGHGADLIRQMILIPFSLVLNQNLLRYFWNFFALAIGVLGFYSLLTYLTKNKQASFLGACFYLLNIGTVQNFYVTFEPFSSFFAFLPWLIYFLFKYLNKAKKKTLLMFFFLSLLGTSFAYVQTTFLVYLILLAIILLFYIFKKNIVSKKEKALNSLKILIIVFLTNAFWLLPLSLFTLKNIDTTIKAKGNLMTTEPVFLRNNKFGNFRDLIQLKGYWFDFTDFDQWGNAVFLLEDWKVHFQNPLITSFSFIYFALLLLGITSIFTLKKLPSAMKRARYSILALFLFSCFILLGSNPPFGFIYDFLRENLPLFGQVFRSSFTKWIVPYSLFYSLLLTFGLAFLFSIFKKKIWQRLVAGAFFLSLIFYSLPSFTGNFFYSRLRIAVPDAYFQLFDYFKDEAPQSSRIANLPQHSFYGWQWNDWGYRGSGFIWYGIKQPILDRAFDVWSEASERYYWQLQAALDKKDIGALENVLAQYDVDYLLLDGSIINRNTKKPFNYQAIKDLLLSSEQIKLVEEFDFISLYTFSDSEKSREKNFISLYKDLPIIVNDYRFTWEDKAFISFHDYLNKENIDQAEVIFLFSSLFSNHLQKDLEFTLGEDDNYFYLTNLRDSSANNFQLNLPDLLGTETHLPFRLSWLTDENMVKLNFTLLAPEIDSAKQKINFNLVEDFVFNISPCSSSEVCYININNQLISQINEGGELDLLLNTDLPNTIALSTDSKIDYFDFAFFDLELEGIEITKEVLPENPGFRVKIPKILLQSNLLETELNLSEAEDCRPLQEGFVAKEQRSEGNYYRSVDTSVCDHFYLENLDHSVGYLFKLKAQNISSLPLVFAVQADSLGRSPLETYLSEGVNYQILPPTEEFNQGYTLYFSTDSYGREVNENLLESAEVFFWPYHFLKNIALQNIDRDFFKNEMVNCDFEVKKSALWLYRVSLSSNCDANYLKLSQAYDSGWLAYQAGQRLEHRKLNNWANAWILNNQDSDSLIYIFYWPQFLQYFGFLAIALGFIGIFYCDRKKPITDLDKKTNQ